MKMSNPNLTTVHPPQVIIFHHPQAKNTPCLLEVKYGLEEEGIPFSCQEKGDFTSLEKLAYAAAEASTLGVGLGVDQNQNVVLHYHRLQPDSPLFSLSGGSCNSILGRMMGSNAARLVKGNPFKSLENEQQEDTSGKKYQEDWVKLITRIVHQVLQEDKGNKEVRG